MSAPCPTSRSSQIPLAGAPTSKWSQKSVTHFTGALMDQMEESVCHALFVLPLCSAPLGCQGYHPACRLTAAYAPSYTEHERCGLILLTLKKALRLKTHQETRTRKSRLTCDMETFSSFQSEPESRLNPNNDLTDTFQRRHSMGHQDPPSKIYTSRRTIVFPVTQSDTHSVATTEMPANANRKRWSRRIRQILASEKGSDKLDISECFHSLVITEDQASASRKNPQASGSPKSKTCELDCEQEGKIARHTRRDRRPHFLPPISQSGYLLDVPFVLPENSPPPSPRSFFSTPFFPLSVPALPALPQQGQRDT
ncbi:uncharacterized protein Hap1MRO34_002201 isoform 2-T4 [Clarias gariepinus]